MFPAQLTSCILFTLWVYPLLQQKLAKMWVMWWRIWTIHYIKKGFSSSFFLSKSCDILLKSLSFCQQVMIFCSMFFCPKCNLFCFKSYLFCQKEVIFFVYWAFVKLGFQSKWFCKVVIFFVKKYVIFIISLF